MISEAISQPAERAEYEQINTAELARALDDFALARGVNLALDTQEGSLALASESPMPVTEDKTQEELRTDGYNDMWRSYDLLEGIGTESERAGKPGCTVCIPLAILNNEDVSGMPDVMDLIRQSQLEWGRDINVIVWANAGYTQDESQEDVAQRADVAYQALRAVLETKAGNGIQIMTALEVLPKEKPHMEAMTVNEAAMNRVRSHYEDAVSILAAESGYGFDHPVIWLDADMKFMPSNALEDLSEAVRSFDGLLAHADIQFTTEWVGDKGLAAMDDATKAVAINEIQRRQMKRMGGQLQRGGYVEECGLAHAVGVGLRAGGIDTSILSHTDESVSLRRRIILRSFYAGHGEGAVPRKLMELVRGDAEYYDVTVDLPVRSVCIGLSARGQRRAVQRDGVQALQADYRDGYVLYSDAGPERIAPEPIGREEMNDLLAHNGALYHVSDDPETAQRLRRSQDRLGRLVSRLFDDPSQQSKDT